jgi:aldehyde dehydrogenase (NAD+)
MPYRYTEFYPDGPQNSKSYARIVTDAHFERLKSLLDRTSGTVVVGGLLDASAKFIAPTIVKDVSLEDSLMSE